MTREKKKWSYQKLEDHTVIWATDRLDEIRDLSDRVYLDQSIVSEEKEFIYSGLARQVCHLLELITPLDHDEDHLVEWATEFVNEYETYDDNSYEG